MASEKDNPKKPGFNYLRLWSITVPLMLAVGLLGYLGSMLDNYLNWNFPVFLLLGIFAGIVGAVIKLLRELDKKP